VSRPVIAIRGLTFSYNGQPALADVSLSVTEGERLAVLGPNGGGKTTLLKLILGILRPSAGEIRVFGDQPGRHSARIGYVPQRLDGMAERKDLPITVLDGVLMGPRPGAHSVSATSHEVRAREEPPGRVGYAGMWGRPARFTAELRAGSEAAVFNRPSWCPIPGFLILGNHGISDPGPFCCMRCSPGSAGSCAAGSSAMT